MNIVAIRHPYWLPAMDTGIPPVIEPGDWLLSSWSGNPQSFAIKLDLDKWAKLKTIYGYLGEIPPQGLFPMFSIEVKSIYDVDILKEKPWVEVLAFNRDNDTSGKYTDTSNA